MESGYSYEDGKVTAISHTCGICRSLKHGVRGNENYINSDLNVLNFERIKWGGVRHGDLLYTLFDLAQFKKELIPEPSAADTAIWKGILCAICSCKPGYYPGVLRDKLKDIPGLRSSKDERSVLIEILACIGVLTPKSYNRPTSGKHDWKFAEYWRGEDGYHAEIAETYFGKYLYTTFKKAACQFADNIIKKFHIQMAFYCQLIVFLELTRPNNVQMVHSFNARNASSTSE